MSKKATRTPQEALLWLEQHGVTQTEFARRVKTNRLVVANLLHGRCKGKRGEGHRIAILLGLKPAPKGQPPFSLEDA